MSRPVHYEIPKQPGEQIIVPGFDFANQMEVGETIADADITIFERVSGDEVTADMLVPGSEQVDGSNVSFRVKAGEHNLDYYCTVTATLNSARALISEIILFVRERPY